MTPFISTSVISDSQDEQTNSAPVADMRWFQLDVGDIEVTTFGNCCFNVSYVTKNAAAMMSMPPTEGTYLRERYPVRRFLHLCRHR